MILLIDFIIFKKYFDGIISKNELKEKIRYTFYKALTNIQPIERNYKYYYLEYKGIKVDNKNLIPISQKSRIIYAHSKIFAYNYFLFENDEDDIFRNCIEYWLENNDSIIIYLTLNNIRNFNENKIDLIKIFDNFFSQNNGIIFSIFETKVKNDIIQQHLE